jgi:hypothetical protein
MIYEVRTYTLKPGSVQAYEDNFEEGLAEREKLSPLAAFWHTEIGLLNQVIHVWPYENLEERNRIRGESVKSGKWPPRHDDLILNMESEIWTPAEFMQTISGVQKLGNIYEMRIYTYKPGSLGDALKKWGDAIKFREKYSRLAFGMYTDIGGLNKWMHVWPYEDLQDRTKTRAEAMKDPNWPPATREFIVKQENKILVPASFSPLH